MAGRMNPKERYVATLKGQKPDRLPLTVGSYDTFLRHYYGMTARQFVDEPETNAEFTVRFLEEFEISCALPGVSYILYGCGPEVGVQWEFAGEAAPAAVSAPIHNREDLDRWQMPSKPVGYFKNYLDTCRLIQDKIGDRVYLRGTASGPFTVACFLRGIEDTLLDSKIDTGFYDAVMTKCVAHSKFIGEHVVNLGLSGNILVDVFLTPEMMPPAFYHERIAPYNAQVLQHFAAQGKHLADSQAAVMGKKDDPASQREGEFVFHCIFGTRESLEAIQIGMKHFKPGTPARIALSARMMSTWPKEQVIDFLKRALDYVVGEQGRSADVSLPSVDTIDRDVARECAEKIRAVNRVLDEYPL